MSILLPPANHPARELINVHDLAVYFAPENVDKIPNGIAITKAKENIKASEGFITSINVICRIDQEYFLMQVSENDVKKLWNFTTGEV